MINKRCQLIKNNLFFLTVLLFHLFNPTAASAGDRVLSIQSVDIPPYQEAIKGFQSACSKDIRRIVISEIKGRDIIKEIREQAPAIILAIGMDALEKIKDIDHIPVIYLMIPNPDPTMQENRNFTGVRMNIKQEDQVSLFLKAVPSIKNIGLLYTAGKSGSLAQRAIDACKNAGVNVIAKEVMSSRDVPAEIKGMEGSIDGFWMLPDVTVFSSEGIEYLFLFSMKNKIPILTFSEIHLESGALISVGMDPFDMGAQAGEMAQELLKGKSVSDMPPADARKALISINMKIAGKLGITIDMNLFPGAEFLK
ncbi:MAG: ABC transporter substrate-binding protein [Deltaproteobacteria bacterium]|nr:ABC transporter substrate-binding protein [Deltaproteobacteria bacterium]